MLLDRPTNRAPAVASTTTSSLAIASANDDDASMALLHDDSNSGDSKDGGIDKGSTPEALCRYWIMKRVKAKTPSGGGAGSPELSKELFMTLAKQLTMVHIYTY
jgi:hypothetical protein